MKGVSKMEVATQLALFLNNRPGALARVCAALSEAGINILAFSMSDTVDHTVLRMVVSDPQRALVVFEDRGRWWWRAKCCCCMGTTAPDRLPKSPVAFPRHGSTSSMRTARPARANGTGFSCCG